MTLDGTVYLVTNEASVLMISSLKYSSLSLTNYISVSFNSSTKLITAGSSLFSPLSAISDTAFYIAGSLNKQISLFKVSANFTNWVVSIKDSIGLSTNPMLKTLDSFNTSA
jgi:hypothetical protein